MGIALVGYILVVGIAFGRALFPPDGLMIFGDDIHRQYYFFRQFFNHWVSQGTFPWWNPYLFSGEPFIANPVVNIWYPVNWLFAILPLNSAYSWHLAIHIWWAMVGMFVLLCSTTRIENQESRIGAWIGGLIFGLSGFFMARTFAGHVDVIAAASWMPWVVHKFYGLIRAEVGISWFSRRQGPDRDAVHNRFTAKAVTALETKRLSARNFIVTAGVFALQLLAGYQTMAFMTAIAVGIVALVHSSIAKSLRPLLRAGVAGVGGVGLAAFHLLPVAEFFRQSIRTYALPYRWHSYGAIEWRSLLQLLNPFQFGNQYTYNGPPPNFIEHGMFVGIGGLILAIVGAMSLIKWCAEVGISWFSRRQGPDRDVVHNRLTARAVTALETKRLPAHTVIFVCITIFGLWVSLGPNAPLDLQHLLWKTVPMYQYLRIPARHLVLVVFGLAGLAGIGLQSISTKFEARNSKQIQNTNIQILKKFRISNLGFRISTIITAIIVAEMVWFARGFIELKPVPETRHDKELITLLTPPRCGYPSTTSEVVGECEPFRVLQNFGVWLPERDALDFDSVMQYGIFSATGYDPSILRSYFEYASRGNGAKAVLSHDVQIPYVTDPKALDRLNIKYLMVPKAYDPFAGNPRFRLIRDTTYRVYENTTVRPRFFSSCGSITVGSYTPNRIELAVDHSCGGNLESSEIWYPGWEAFIDGRKEDITQSEGTFRTLFVSAGKHTVVYQYNPRVFVYGAALSVLTATVLFLMVFMKRKPQRR